MSSYKVLNKQVFTLDNYSLVPIRMEDRFSIMKWRNEQIYHLRQSEPLTEEMQDNYFKDVISKLFVQERPNQLLFSYLHHEECIGYGGLVHINWVDKNAEISFIMNTALEKEEFHKHWRIYLDLLEQIAFEELDFHKMYTYAFDLRPHLYKALEANHFEKEAILKEHCLFEDRFIDVVIHSKINPNIFIRNIHEKDKKITFEWANDKLTRENSFKSQFISFEEHSQWFDNKLKAEVKYYILEVDNNPASIVRFDLSDSKIVVGITVSPEYRGKGLAPIFLRTACNKFIAETGAHLIYAYIKTSNIASRRSFEKAGFLFSRNVFIDNLEALEYIYER